MLRPPQGRLLCHASGMRHAGHAISRGVRWVLVVFLVSTRAPQLVRRCSNLAAAEARLAAAAEAARAGRERGVLSEVGRSPLARLGGRRCARRGGGEEEGGRGAARGDRGCAGRLPAAARLRSAPVGVWRRSEGAPRLSRAAPLSARLNREACRALRFLLLAQGSALLSPRGTPLPVLPSTARGSGRTARRGGRDRTRSHEIARDHMRSHEITRGV